MDFRTRLLLGLVGLALLTAGWQAGLGYAHFRGSLDADLRGDLQKYLDSAVVAVSLEGGFPSLDPERLSRVGYVGRVRVSRQRQVYLENGGVFPVDSPDWITRSQPLEGGFLVEAALNQAEHNAALDDYLRASLSALLLNLILAVGLALLLLRYLIRPLSRLEQATQALTLERYPQPLPNAGRDEVGRLTRSFNVMVAKLRAAAERERSFTRYASHELRTPLAAIRANLGAVKAEALPPEALLPVLEENLVQMDSTLSGLLALARGLDEAQPVEVGSLLQEIVAALSPEQQARVCLNIQPKTLSLPRAAVGGVVRNLVENALKYSSGAVKLGFVGGRIWVRDFGPGVPQAALPRLTEPFFRGKHDGGGSGLGLAYVRQVIEAMGGRLELSNHPEGGFLATVWLEVDYAD